MATRYKVGDKVEKVEWTTKFTGRINEAILVPVWKGKVIGVNKARGGNPTVYLIRRNNGKQHRLMSSQVRKIK